MADKEEAIKGFNYEKTMVFFFQWGMKIDTVKEKKYWNKN